MAAFAAAGAADPALAAAVAELAGPGRASSWPGCRRPRPGSDVVGVRRRRRAPPAGTGRAGVAARPGRRGRHSHATACVDQSGARAALLGSIAAGLRGQDGQLA